MYYIFKGQRLSLKLSGLEALGKEIANLGNMGFYGGGPSALMSVQYTRSPQGTWRCDPRTMPLIPQVLGFYCCC